MSRRRDRGNFRQRCLHWLRSRALLFVSGRKRTHRTHARAAGAALILRRRWIGPPSGDRDKNAAFAAWPGIEQETARSTSRAVWGEIVDSYSTFPPKRFCLNF